MEWLINTLYYVIPFVVLLGILVFVHEFGHFIVARLCGVQVETFLLVSAKRYGAERTSEGQNGKFRLFLWAVIASFWEMQMHHHQRLMTRLPELSEEQKKVAFPYQNPF